MRRILSVVALALFTVFLIACDKKCPTCPDGPTPTPTPLPDTVIPIGAEVYGSPKLITFQFNSTVPLEYPAGCFKILPTRISPGRGSQFFEHNLLSVTFSIDICDEAPILEGFNEFEIRVRSYDSNGVFVGFLGKTLRVPKGVRSTVFVQSFPVSPIANVPPFIYSVGVSFYLLNEFSPSALVLESNRNEVGVVHIPVDWRRGY